MELEKPVTVVIGWRELLCLAILAGLALRPAALSTESLAMTSYYPSPYGVYQRAHATTDANFAYIRGSVGIGTRTPAAGAKLHVAGQSAVSRFDGRVGIGGDPVGGAKLHVSGEGDISRFDGRVGLNGPFWGGYGGAVTVMRNYATNTGNIYVQGNENDEMLRIGDAWGMNGAYADGGDLVLGAETGRVRIGPDGGSQILAHACRRTAYSEGSSTFCERGWSVLSASNIGEMGGGSTQFYAGADPVHLWTHTDGNMYAFRYAASWPTQVKNAYISTLPTSGLMLCCKLETY